MDDILEHITELSKRVDDLIMVVERLQGQVDTLTSLCGSRQQQAARPRFIPSSYGDRIYALCGKFRKCQEHDEYKALQEEYRKILAEVRATYPEQYEDFKNARNEQVRKCTIELRKRWPAEREKYAAAVEAKTVPLTEDTRYDKYFSKEEDALEYIAQNASCEDVVSKAIDGFCRDFGGLNKTVYKEIAIQKWKTLRQ